MNQMIFFFFCSHVIIGYQKRRHHPIPQGTEQFCAFLTDDLIGSHKLLINTNLHSPLSPPQTAKRFVLIFKFDLLPEWGGGGAQTQKEIAKLFQRPSPLLHSSSFSQKKKKKIYLFGKIRSDEITSL